MNLKLQGNFQTKYSPTGFYYESGNFNEKKVYKHEHYGYLIRYTDNGRWEINDMLIYSTISASETGNFDLPWQVNWNEKQILIEQI